MSEPEIPVAASEPVPAPDVPSPRPTPPVPAIDARVLTKVFQGKPAVDRLTLQVARGRFFGFLGPNGAGKSTTIKMLTGLLRPTSGEAFVEGRDLAKDRLAIKQLIGVLPEELPLYERLTGEEYLLFAGRMYGLQHARPWRVHQRLVDLVAVVGRHELLDDGHVPTLPQGGGRP